MWNHSNPCLFLWGLYRIAWISTLLCISAPSTLITMTFRAACSFSFQYTLIMEWQVKKPHAVVGSQIPASLSHVKQFQMGLPLSCYNKASALWHGKKCIVTERCWKSHWGTARASLCCPGFDRDTSRWVVGERPAYSSGAEVEKRRGGMTRPGNETRVRDVHRADEICCSLAKFGSRSSSRAKKRPQKNKVSSEAVLLPNAAELELSQVGKRHHRSFN